MKLGKRFVIASTSHDHFESKEKTITGISVSGGRTVLTLDRPLKYKHYAGVQTFGDLSYLNIKILA